MTPKPSQGIAAWHRSKRLRAMWHGVEVHCSCGAHWFGWIAISNATIRDHYEQGHQLSDRPPVEKVPSAVQEPDERDGLGVLQDGSKPERMR